MIVALELKPVPKERRKQVEIGRAMTTFFAHQKSTFSLGELIQALKMNRRAVTDWLQLYQVFYRGPPLWKIKVNDHTVYEVLRGEGYNPQNLGRVELYLTRETAY
jgi:hypothetical protein